MELARTDNVMINYFVEALKVAIKHVRVAEHINSTNVIEVDASIIFAEEEILDFPLSGLINIKTVLIENSDINNALIKGRDTDMNAAHCIGITNKVAGHRYRNLIDIKYVDTG